MSTDIQAKARSRTKYLTKMLEFRPYKADQLATKDLGGTH